MTGWMALSLRPLFLVFKRASDKLPAMKYLFILPVLVALAIVGATEGGHAQDAYENTDIFAPWNDPLLRDDIFAPWNDLIAGEEETNEYLREEGVSDSDYYWE
jgi:hypothetical protein